MKKDITTLAKDVAEEYLQMVLDGEMYEKKVYNEVKEDYGFAVANKVKKFLNDWL